MIVGRIWCLSVYLMLTLTNEINEPFRSKRRKSKKRKENGNPTLPLKAFIHGVCQMIKKRKSVRLKIHVADSPSSPFHQTVVQFHDV